MSDHHFHSELIGEFQKERQRRARVEKTQRNSLTDPRPIVITDGSGKKIASYELDMVRWSRPLLYEWCCDANQPLGQLLPRWQICLSCPHQINHYVGQREPVAEEETGARGHSNDYQASSGGNQDLPREYPSWTLQSVVSNENYAIYFFRKSRSIAGLSRLTPREKNTFRGRSPTRTWEKIFHYILRS